MLERKDAIKNEFLEPILFVLAFPTVFLWQVFLWEEMQKRVARNVWLMNKETKIGDT